MTLADVNERFAIVGVGNRMCVMEFAPDRSIVELWDYENFKKKLIKEWARVERGGKVKLEPLADVWLKHRDGRQYERLVYDMPGSPIHAGPNDYNGWQGFSVEPKHGDWSRNKAHIRDIICGGNDEWFAWVVNWMAALVQRPGQHAWTAIVLRGGQGIGKGHFADKMIGRLFGSQQYLHILGSGQLTAEFNEHLSGKVFIFADESTWGGDPRAAAKLKGIITEDLITIHRKFLKMIDEYSMLHTIIASNNEWPIPIDAGDRRFSVFDVDESRKQDQVYFGQLLAELSAGGRAAMLHELLALDVNDKWLRTPLMSQSKAEIAAQSLKAIEHWWLSMLESGNVLDNEWPDFVPKRTLHDMYHEFLDKHHRSGRERRSTETEMGMFLRKFSNASQQMLLKGKMERVIYLPPLIEARSAWVKAFGWPSDYAWDRDLSTAVVRGEAWEAPEF